MKKRILLKTLSPVHIGGRTQELTPLEAVVFAGRCYVIDEYKLGRVLLAQNKLDSISHEINRQGPRFNLEGFIRGLKLLNQGFLEESSSYSCSTSISSTPRRLRPFVRDAYNCPFIPGSSIKGVLRTAILYGILKKMRDENPEEFQRRLPGVVARKLQEFDNAEEWKKYKPWFKDNIKRNMAGSIEQGLLQGFDLPVPGSLSRRGPTGQQRDIMRAIKVSDSNPLNKDVLSLVEVKVLSLTGKNEIYLKTPIYVEVIPPGTELEFSITLDESILGDFKKKAQGPLPFNSLEDVISKLNSFTTDLWGFEKGFWDGVSGLGKLEMSNFYQNKPAGMRLGWGSGLSGASLLLLLPEEQRRELRDALFEPREQFEFPKSRRAVMDGDTPRWPLGWVKWEICGR